MKTYVKIIILTIMLTMILSGCQNLTETITQNKQTVTESPVVFTPTETEQPTTTLTATPEPTVTNEMDKYIIDVEKFWRVAPSYEYLLAHPDEFVHAPDPITDRAVFDKWFTEELMPMIGPRDERQLNAIVDALCHNSDMYSAWPHSSTEINGKLGFFYFEYYGTIVPVVIINVSRDPDYVEHTFCVGLFGGPGSPTGEGTETLQLLASGTKFNQLDIFYSTCAELLTGVSLGEMAQSFIDSSGDDRAYLPDNVTFGLGQLYLQ
ncbi:MAG: hypothetical protein ABFD14_09235 [Anaerolineaceae bacterium]